MLGALRYARQKGVTVVAAAGNQADAAVAYPARAGLGDRGGRHHRQRLRGRVLERRRRISTWSRPGGGIDAPNDDNPWDAGALPARRARPLDLPADLHARRVGASACPSGYEGTSMASPHVTGIVALLIATKRLGAHPDAGAGGGPPRGHGHRRSGRPASTTATAAAS